MQTAIVCPRYIRTGCSNTPQTPAAHVTHIVPPDLSGGVCQAIWVLGTRGIQEDARRLNGVPRQTYNASPLPVMIARFISVHNTDSLPGLIVFNFQDV